MKRAILCLWLILSLTIGFMPVAAQEADVPRVYLNGTEIVFSDANPQNVSGRTMVPFRAICEAFGASVGYDAETGTVLAVRNDISISFQNGAETLSYKSAEGSASLVMDVPPFLDAETERTFVPVRFFSEIFGLSVTWNGSDVLVADFETMVERFASENPLLSALLAVRNPRPLPFRMYETFQTEGAVTIPLENQTVSGQYSRQGTGERAALLNGSAFDGTETISLHSAHLFPFLLRDLPDGTYENVKRSTLRLGNTDYEKNGVYDIPVERGIFFDQARVLNNWWHTDSAPFTGNAWMAALTEDLLFSAKSTQDCLRDAARSLADQNRSPAFYAQASDTLDELNAHFSPDWVVVRPGSVDLAIVRDETGSAQFTVNLQITVSDQGDILAVRLDSAHHPADMPTEILHQTDTRIPGTPGEYEVPEQVMTTSGWRETIEAVTVK